MTYNIDFKFNLGYEFLLSFKNQQSVRIKPKQISIETR